MDTLSNTSKIDHEYFCRQTWAISHVFFLIVSKELLQLVLGQIEVSSILPWILFLLAMTTLWSKHNFIFIAMLFAQIVYSLHSLPDLQNHRYLTLFVNIGLLINYKNKQFFTQNTIWLISKILMVVYFFAAFHKLNSDFLDPQFSCATQFTNNIEMLLPFLKGSILDQGYLQIYGTIILEFLLVILLISKRTWKFAAIVSLCFHLALTSDFVKLFLNFSSVMIGLFTIITAKRFNSSFFSELKIIRPLLLVTTFTLLVPTYFGTPHFWHIFIVQAVFLFFCFRSLFSIISSEDNSFPITTKFADSKYFASIILLIVVFINAASPYLNIKDRGAFNMYSNLQVSEEFSNHLLIPKSIDLFGLTKTPRTGVLGTLLPKVQISPEKHDICSW